MEQKRRTLFVLVGPPSVGKSSWISSTFKDKPYIISRDDIVEEVAAENGWSYDDLFVSPPEGAELGEVDEKYGEVVPAPAYMPWTKTVYSKVLKANGKVHYLFTQKIGGAAAADTDVVVDMTNMNTSARKQALSMVGDSDFRKVAVVFQFKGAEDIVKKVAAKRAAAAKRAGKSKTIPDSVMDKMFSAFSQPSKSEGFDEIISVDNRELLKRIANEPERFEESKMDLKKKWKIMVEGRSLHTDWNEDEYTDSNPTPEMAKENFENSRWQQLAGVLKEQSDYSFDERLPPGWEDHGANAIVINDIGEELLTIKADAEGLHKAEVLLKRLARAIEAMKLEVGELDEAAGTNDSVDGPYTEEMNEQAAPLDFSGNKKDDKEDDSEESKETLEECGEEEDFVIEWGE